jgi:hypothetical protein
LGLYGSGDHRSCRHVYVLTQIYGL